MTPMDIAKARVRDWQSGLLDLSELGLTELPELPAGLTEFYCHGNRLTRLPDTLPSTLVVLDCSNNQLTRLPDTLPEGLEELWCHYNELTTLPDTLPKGLTMLYCYGNNLSRREENESIQAYAARVNAEAEAESRERITERCEAIFEELAQKMWHPSRVEQLMLAGVDMEDM